MRTGHVSDSCRICVPMNSAVTFYIDRSLFVLEGDSRNKKLMTLSTKTLILRPSKSKYHVGRHIIRQCREGAPKSCSKRLFRCTHYYMYTLLNKPLDTRSLLLDITESGLPVFDNALHEGTSAFSVRTQCGLLSSPQSLANFAEIRFCSAIVPGWVLT
jgi:hypothetical protein